MAAGFSARVKCRNRREGKKIYGKEYVLLPSVCWFVVKEQLDERCRLRPCIGQPCQLHFSRRSLPVLFPKRPQGVRPGVKTSPLGVADLTAQSESYVERQTRIRDSGRDDRLGLGGFTLVF